MLIFFCFIFVTSCFNIIILSIFLLSIFVFLPLIILVIITSTNILINYLDKQINLEYNLLDEKGISYVGVIKNTFESIFLTLNNSVKSECKKSIFKKDEELLKIENKLKMLTALKSIFLKDKIILFLLL